MFNKEVTYSYNDIALVPAIVSSIAHRSECNTRDENNKLPIFTAPMSSVVCQDNFHLFEEQGINAIMPRNVDIKVRLDYINKGYWSALSLSEFNDFINNKATLNRTAHIVIDVANGNMSSIFELSKTAKEKFGKDNIILMSGNIANPQTYLEYCKAGIDYVRCSIGSGCGCITSTQTAIHYGIASLLNEVYKLKEWVDGEIGFFSEFKCLTKIVADGGIRGYADVIKALALGADYVMVGSVFSQLIESSAKTYYTNPLNEKEIKTIDVFNPNCVCREQDGIYSLTTPEDKEEDFKLIPQLYKVFYGMASKRGQEDLFGSKKGTVEGITKTLPATTNLDKWVGNMDAYLKSAMSYCNIKNIKDFNCDNVDTIIISNNTNNSVNK